MIMASRRLNFLVVIGGGWQQEAEVGENNCSVFSGTLMDESRPEPATISCERSPGVATHPSSAMHHLRPWIQSHKNSASYLRKIFRGSLLLKSLRKYMYVCVCMYVCTGICISPLSFAHEKDWRRYHGCRNKERPREAASEESSTNDELTNSTRLTVCGWLSAYTVVSPGRMNARARPSPEFWEIGLQWTVEELYFLYCDNKAT